MRVNVKEAQVVVSLACPGCKMKMCLVQDELPLHARHINSDRPRVWVWRANGTNTQAHSMDRPQRMHDDSYRFASVHRRHMLWLHV